MSIHALCSPRPSVFAADRRATVLNLDTFLRAQVDGPDFFAENYFTNGMLTLVDRAFRHLGGSGAGSSVFLLSQAMGGGKTHSMIALGLLARDPELRKNVLGDQDPAPKLGPCSVVGFNGRSSDAPGGIWGSIAEQLGKADQFAKYVSPLLSAPGPEAWKQLLGGDPLVLFLDELPPYLANAVAVPVGNGDLGVVTTTALANLFIAVAEMDNVCLVLSDLAGTSYGGGQAALEAAFNRATQGISGEARRIPVPITPVNPNGDELYHKKKRYQRNPLFGRGNRPVNSSCLTESDFDTFLLLKMQPTPSESPFSRTGRTRKVFFGPYLNRIRRARCIQGKCRARFIKTISRKIHRL